MKLLVHLAVTIGLIAVAVPCFAAESGTAPAYHSLRLTPLGARVPVIESARPTPALPALEAVAAGPVEERPCSLVTLNDPELLTLPAARPLFLAHRAAPSYLSLGGPSLTLTSPDALPSLRDPAAAPADPEDTLRVIRSHW
jgi:hypothetical protein